MNSSEDESSPKNAEKDDSQYQQEDTETQIIFNEGAEDDLSYKIDSAKKKSNRHSVNSSSNPKKNEKNENIKEKPTSNDCAEELIKKAIGKNTNRGVAEFELDEEGNTLSTKVSEALYLKFVGKNENKSKHLDILSKIKDEEILQGREATKTRDDIKRINNMIVRQEDYEKVKSNKRKDRQRAIKNKINEECVFNPNGKKNVNASRSPSEFFKAQQEFIDKIGNKIQKLENNLLKSEKEISSVVLTSKVSEKLASLKNPNESKEEFCNRLAGEKLKTIKESIEIKPNKEEKKLTKEEVKNLTEKLFKESEKFKKNRVKKEQEVLKQIKTLGKDEFALQQSNKVLLKKFILSYERALIEIFNKTGNFSINIDEYQKILLHLGCITNANININENLIKDSFNNYLKQSDDKIDTYAFLLFCLAALGIYKGKDEKMFVNENKIQVPIIEEDKKSSDDDTKKSYQKTDKNKNNSNSSELIKYYIQDLDLEKYGYSNKEVKVIKHKFLPFISGISSNWAKELIIKKQKRQEKIEEAIKKNNLEEATKLANKLKRDEDIIDSFRRKLLETNSNEVPNENKNNLNSNNLNKSYKVEDMYEIFQKKKKRELDNLKARQEAGFLAECTFQPNLKTKPVNKNEIKKNIEKLYIEGKNSYLRKKNTEDKNPEDTAENEKNCTFKPLLNDFKGDYFGNNPLKEDKHVNKELKKMEKLRETKGYSEMEIKSPMAFGIEQKSNKDEIYKRAGKNEKIYGGDIFEEDYKNGEAPLLKVEVNLDENNKIDKLIIYPGDDYIKVTNQFCDKHEINDEKRNRLIKIIKDKLNSCEGNNEG